jgi:hypothetical protein
VKTVCSMVTGRWFVLALLMAAIGCSNMAKPGPQSAAGMSPDGTISMTEIVAAGAAGGKGTLAFQGHSYPFRLALQLHSLLQVRASCGGLVCASPE